jgi:NAD(P)H-nitrite reductase large subunit
MTAAPVHRRHILRAALAASAAAAFPMPAISQGAGPPVIVIGGGFGGASCVRALRRADPRIAVTLVEVNAIYTAPPQSNAVIAGLADLKAQQFGYGAIRKAGVNVVISAATAIDPQARTVSLTDGAKLSYERLVLSPGIEFRAGAIPGYDAAAMVAMRQWWPCRRPIMMGRRSRPCGASLRRWTTAARW